MLLKPNWTLVIFFVAGFTWGYVHSQTILSQKPHSLDSSAYVEGQIISSPSGQNDSRQFTLNVVSLNHKKSNFLIHLSCYRGCHTLNLGQNISALVKLKSIHSLHNPGTRDSEQYFHASHIFYKGRILKLFDKPSSHHFIFNLMKMRAFFSEHMGQMVFDSSELGIWEALSLGLTHHLSQTQWDLFRKTGTTHLMIISGAHIGLVAGLIFKLVTFIWSYFTQGALLIPAQRAGAIGGMMGASFYAALAGMGVPAQRSLIGCLVAFSRYFFSRRFHIWQGFKLGLFIVLCVEPHVVFFPGFYLSFLAVAVLILSSQKIKKDGLIKTIKIQIACLLGLFPLTLYWFSYGSVNGIFANLVAIPLVGLIIVPLSLITMLISSVTMAHIWFYPLHYSIFLLVQYLEMVDKLAWMNVKAPITTVSQVLLLMIGGYVVYTLPKKGYQLAGCVLLVMGIFSTARPPKLGHFQLNVMDVGQGLAAIIQTHSHYLVYDTGVKFFQGGDMSKMVILPYLNTIHAKKIDKIIISHPDLDHRGGLDTLRFTYPNAELLVNEPKMYTNAHGCHEVKPWHWEGVAFEFLPIHEPLGRNNTSCVLRVCAKSHCVLLTGDIESKAENYLVNHYVEQLKADVLVIPHHQSKTSSSPRFLMAVSPYYAIASYGANNLYHFPHQEIVRRYQDLGIPVYDTEHGGMISVSLSSEGGTIHSYH